MQDMMIIINKGNDCVKFCPNRAIIHVWKRSIIKKHEQMRHTLAWTRWRKIDIKKARFLAVFFKKKIEKGEKKWKKAIALRWEMLYNQSVVCLWDETASCRPALAGNCGGPARRDRATDSHFLSLTMRTEKDGKRDPAEEGLPTARKTIRQGYSPLGPRVRKH